MGYNYFLHISITTYSDYESDKSSENKVDPSAPNTSSSRGNTSLRSLKRQ